MPTVVKYRMWSLKIWWQLFKSLEITLTLNNKFTVNLSVTTKPPNNYSHSNVLAYSIFWYPFEAPRNIFLQNKHYCLHYFLLHLRSINGSSVVPSRDPIAMNEPITRLNNFFEQLSVRWIWDNRLSKRDNRVWCSLRQLLFVFLCSVRFFVTVDNA
jgi:hypothetical protein